jgi:hypothetical protein
MKQRSCYSRSHFGTSDRIPQAFGNINNMYVESIGLASIVWLLPVCTNFFMLRRLLGIHRSNWQAGSMVRTFWIASNWMSIRFHDLATDNRQTSSPQLRRDNFVSNRSRSWFGRTQPVGYNQVRNTWELPRKRRGRLLRFVWGSLYKLEEPAPSPSLPSQNLVVTTGLGNPFAISLV